MSELRTAQQEDLECQIFRKDIGNGECTQFVEDERGIVCRKAPVDGALQMFVSKELRPSLLHLAHHTPAAGYSG